jgi:hypothetical protein
MGTSDIQINNVLCEKRVNFFFILRPSFLVSLQLLVLVFSLTRKFLLFSLQTISIYFQTVALRFEQILKANKELFDQSWKRNIFPLLKERQQRLLMLSCHVLFLTQLVDNVTAWESIGS